MNLKEAKRELSNAAFEDLRDGDGWFTECNDDLNDKSRAVIRAYEVEYGEAWLVKVNLYNDQEVPMWKHDGRYGIVYNFSCCGVIPHYDAELERLILERKHTKYEGTGKDTVLINVIFDRMHELGGTSLIWT